MRLIRRCPLGNRPEAIHQTSWTVRKFVGKPPLVAERSMRLTWQTLEIRDPVEGTQGLLFVTLVACTGKVQRLDGGEPRRVTVAALVRLIAAKGEAVALLGRYGCAVHPILRPSGSGFDPFDQLPGVLLPPSVILGMQDDIASKLQRNHVIHILHVGRNVLKVPGPNIVL